MKDFCENHYCENPGAKVVPVSVEKPSDEKRTLCVPCEEAYTWGVQHGTKMAQAKAVMPDKNTALCIDQRELATILAGLRLHQEKNLQGERKVLDGFLGEIATDGGTLEPLSFEEVNALCEKLNFDAITTPGLVITPPPKESKPPLYRVVYVIDVNAANSRHAARETRQIMTDPDSLLPVLQVMDHRGRVKRVDLSDERPSRQKGKHR